ncbi:MAG TPA: gas vesicle protein, partial [Chloroflexota bacterium]|nr:gas vesicle protein [Chloroflexota bacterium]
MTSSSSALPRSGDPSQTDARSVPALFQREATLVDAVDHLLNRGAVLVGEATISLAGVELIYVGLNLLVSSVETLREAAPGVASPPRPLSSGAGEGEDPVPSPAVEGEGQGEGLPRPSPLSSSAGEG